MAVLESSAELGAFVIAFRLILWNDFSQIPHHHPENQPRILLKLAVQMFPDERDSGFAEYEQLLVRFVVGLPEAIRAVLAEFSLLYNFTQ
ncbi:hypothetical protein ACFVVQ_18500 [Paenibacillus chitinolyticus]|uniref:hypothetical protein n=1 Tax=Paenibacillus chitinolyticus TaxID=79263 RepID=UPI0036D9405F